MGGVAHCLIWPGPGSIILVCVCARVCMCVLLKGMYVGVDGGSVCACVLFTYMVGPNVCMHCQGRKGASKPLRSKSCSTHP